MIPKRYSTYYRKKRTTRSNNYKVDDFEFDRKFVEWVDKVEYIVLSNLHMNLLDLPDEPYVMNFEEGVTPEDMAKKVIDNNSLNLF